MIGAIARFTPAGPGLYTGSIDASWCQGPGIYGGLVAAALGDALEREIPDRPLRALSVHLCAPAPPGPLTVEVMPQRMGVAVSFASARLLGPDGLPVAIASATLARPRALDADFDHTQPPDLPAIAGLLELGEAPGAPRFTRWFDFRFAQGVPFTGQDRAQSEGWVRPRAPEPLGTPLALAMLDVWPLAWLARLPEPRPMSSVVIHLQLLAPLPAAAPDGWYRVRSESALARDGYADQQSALWTADGALVGRCQQLVALVR